MLILVKKIYITTGNISVSGKTFYPENIPDTLIKIKQLDYKDI